MSAAPNIETQREAFYGRADTQHLAPLWTRLKSRVPAEPAPVGVAHRWAYDEVRPYVLEAAEHISAREAERRVLIQLAVRRAAADPARRGGAGAPPHAERAALRRRGRGRLHRGRRREDADGTGRRRHHAALDLAPPRQRLRRADGLARRARHPDLRAVQQHLPRGPPGRRGRHHAAAR